MTFQYVAAHACAYAARHGFCEVFSVFLRVSERCWPVDVTQTTDMTWAKEYFCAYA